MGRDVLVALVLATLAAGCAGQKSTEFIARANGKPVARSKIENLARTDHVALLKQCLAGYEARVRDYACTFIKQERLRGTLAPEQWIKAKFLGKPFSVAMEWIRNSPGAARMLYVQGKYDNMMLIQPAGLLVLVGTVKRRPDGPDAMKNTLRPVTRFGFANALRSLIDVYQAARRAGECTEQFGGYAKVAGRDCLALVRHLPAGGRSYPAWKTTTYIDLEYLLPTCIEALDWDKQLISRYVYRDVKLNLGLKEADFTPAANGIAPPK